MFPDDYCRDVIDHAVCSRLDVLHFNLRAYAAVLTSVPWEVRNYSRKIFEAFVGSVKTYPRMVPQFDFGHAFSHAGIVEWSNMGFPSLRRGFDSRSPLQAEPSVETIKVF